MSASVTNASSKEEVEASSIVSEPSDDEKILNAFSRIEPYEIEGDGIKISLVRKDPNDPGFCMIICDEDCASFKLHYFSTFIRTAPNIFHNNQPVVKDIERWRLCSEDIKKAVSHPHLQSNLFDRGGYNEKFIIHHDQIQFSIDRDQLYMDYKLSKDKSKFVLETILDIFEGWTTIAHEAVHGNHKKAARA